MIRVGIVDDHPIMRWGLQRALERADIEVVAALASAEGMPASPIDVLVLDLFLADDLPCVDVIGTFATRAGVLVVSASKRSADIEMCFRAGARGYVHKGSGLDALVGAVRTVAAGGEVRPPVALPAVAPPGSGGLSPREHQVLHFIASGYTHDQAARRLGVSRHTVDTYVKRLRGKLGVGNKAELTRAAMQLSRLAVHSLGA
jgi:two-component system, NarL family, nitrate/nitrite response regulator NarL